MDEAKFKVMLLHLGFLLLLLAAVWLSVTVLKPYPDLGKLVIAGVTFAWGQLGFKPADAVLERVLAKLDPQRLNNMLSVRPPNQGNSLSPPPAAALGRAGALPVEVPMPPAPPPAGGQS